MPGEGMWRPPLPGLTRIGRYWLECEIGRGGMGAVHLASSRGPDGFKKLLAIKTILPDLEEGERFVRMLLDEARVVSALTHPNIVQLYDLGQDGKLPYLVMEYVHGESLASIERFVGRLPDRLAVDVACQVLDALAYAAEQRAPDGRPLGLVHRDLSPQNILVSYDGVPKLVDFGIARAASRETRTETGVVKGRFHYMPPEQRQGKPVDARADLYALGVVLYEATVGVHPFADGTAELRAPAERPDYPEPLLAVIRRATAPAREERFADATAMLAALREVAVGLGAPVSRPELAGLLREPFAERRRFKEEIVSKGEIGARPTEELGSAGVASVALAATELRAEAAVPASPAPPARRGRWLAASGLAAIALVGGGGVLMSGRAGQARAPVVPAGVLNVCVRADEHLSIDQQQATWPLVRLVASSLERAPGVATIHAYRVLDERGWSEEGGLAARKACADFAPTVDVVVGPTRLEIGGARVDLPAGLSAATRAAAGALSARLHVEVAPSLPAGVDDAGLRSLLEVREFFYFTWGEQRRQRFEAAIREAPQLEEPYLLEALTRWWTGDLDRAEARTLRRPPHPSVRTGALLDAVLALEEDRAADAMRLAQLALEDRRYRQDPIALYVLGEALFHAGRPAEGARTLARALAAEPQMLVAGHHIFQHAIASGDLETAEAFATRWQRVAPADFHALEYRAFIALAAGQYDEAARRFESLLERDVGEVNDQAPAHVGLIYARAFGTDVEGALTRADVVSRAIDRPATVMPEPVGYAISLWRGDAEGAERWAERVRLKLAQVPWASVNTYQFAYGMAIVDVLSGRPDARARWLGAATPQTIARRYRFALSAAALDVIEAFARRDEETLGKLAATSEEAQLTHLAWGYRRELEGRLAEAGEEFEAAIASSGGGDLDCVAAAALARVRLAAGDAAGAGEACKRVLTPFVPRPYCIVAWAACGKTPTLK